MTTTITDTMQPCDTNPACLHPKCRTCGKPVRSSGQNKTEHPGTIEGSIKSHTCGQHRIKAKADHISDSEMAYLQTHHPHAYHYHSDRRKRGIPKDGLKRAKARL